MIEGKVGRRKARPLRWSIERVKEKKGLTPCRSPHCLVRAGHGRNIIMWRRSELDQTKAQLDSSVDTIHGSCAHSPKTPDEPPAVYGTNLIEQRARRSRKPSFWRSNEDFSRVEWFGKL